MAEPENTKPPVAKATKSGTTEICEVIRVDSGAFDVTTEKHIAQAEEIFRAKVAESFGDEKLSDVKLVKVDHHVGTAGFYTFTAKLG